MIHRLIIITLMCVGHITLATQYRTEAFIDDLLNLHTTPASLRQTQQLSTLQFDQTSAITDWQLSAGMVAGRQQPLASSSFSVSQIDTRQYYSQLSRPILGTGGTLSFNFKQQKTTQPPLSFNGISFNKPLFFEAGLGIQYSQPLLYGFSGEIYKLSLDVASSNVRQTTWSTTDELEAFLLTELNAFIDWTLSYELSELSFSRLQLAKESLQEINDRVAVNLSEKIDALRAEYALQNALQLWQSQKADLKAKHHAFAIRLNNPSIRQVTPYFDLYDDPYVKKPEYIRIDNLRPIQQLKAQQTIADQSLSLQQSQRNGSLTLTAGYEFNGGGTDFQSAQHLRHQNTRFGFDYSRPLSDHHAIAAVKSATIKRDQISQQYDQTSRDIHAQIMALYTGIQEYQTILKTTLAQIQLSQQKADEEQGLYLQGRSGIELLLQAQDNVLHAKTNHAQLSAMYQKTILQYLAITDQLLDAYKVTL